MGGFQTVPPVAAKLLVFIDTMFQTEVAGFQGCWKAEEREMGIRQIRTPQSSLFLSKVSCFYSRNSPHIFACLWLIYRVFKKLILTIFSPVVLLLFWENGFSEVFTLCYVDLCPPPNSFVDGLALTVMVLGRRAFGK